MTTKTKIITISSIIVVLALAAFVFFRFCFVYSSGVNAGDINYFQREGVIFKTYEGKMIQSGFKSATATTQGLRSNEFIFSVKDKAIADSLMRCSGKHVELRWKRHFGTLPWRGKSQYIVYEILSVKDPVATESVF
ncbi:MAG: hypothetical protein IJM81_02375 [Prevotella sp.]|nr:hypothetical protein [Prevotella sp.]MBQ6955307.1 hypothetical protein [Bacteroidales bacterium]